MHLSAKDIIARNVMIQMDGSTLSLVREFNTTDGWLRCFVTYTDDDGYQHVYRDAEVDELVSVTIHCHFRVVNRDTGEVLAESKYPEKKLANEKKVANPDTTS